MEALKEVQIPQRRQPQLLPRPSQPAQPHIRSEETITTTVYHNQKAISPTIIENNNNRRIPLEANNHNHHHEDTDKENLFSYNYFSNSARDSRQVANQQQQLKTVQATNTTDHKPCCENYKQILAKLETLCRWRDDFVQAKRIKPNKNANMNNSNGCVLCDSGNLKMCNFCDYHGTIVQGRGRQRRDDRFDDSWTDSDDDSMRFCDDARKPLPSTSQYKMISNTLVDMPTPQVHVRSQEAEREEEGEQWIKSYKPPPPPAPPAQEPRNNSFINFDDIPLPTQRRSMENAVETRRSHGAADDEDQLVMSSSRLRLNEMKKVEWKWDVSMLEEKKKQKHILKCQNIIKFRLISTDSGRTEAPHHQGPAGEGAHPAGRHPQAIANGATDDNRLILIIL